MTSGSLWWQLVFVSFACVLILFEVLRGWRRGLARQLARLGALIAGYFTAYFGGNLVVPLLRPFLKMPDAVLSILAGGVLFILIYAIVNGLGIVLFRRTGQHEAAPVRLLYGLSGAVLGLFFGALLVWILVVGVRSLGAVADAQVHAPAPGQINAVPGGTLRAIDARRRSLSEGSEPVVTTLARLKNSLELGAVGDAVRKADIVPAKVYAVLGQTGKVVSDPAAMQRLLHYPGAQGLSQNPKIVALLNDSEISDMIAQGRLIDLLENQKIRDVLNDPALFEQIKKFDLPAALDYALKKE